LSRLLVRLGVVLGGLLLAGLSIALTFANVVATKAPNLALLLWPHHAVAHARLADTLLASNGQNVPGPQQVALAAQEASAALRA